jgi:hypothetical protein
MQINNFAGYYVGQQVLKELGPVNSDSQNYIPEDQNAKHPA